jgi:predicted nucleic acid-binding protein
VILVDTSVWIDHLRHPVKDLEALLIERRVSTHPLVRLELALGSIANREVVLTSIAALPHVTLANTDELFLLVEQKSLSRRGIGITDLHLLASCLITPGTQLWTRDQRLGKVASTLDIHANFS